MKDHRHQQLEAAVARRDAAQARLLQLQGRLEAAQERVASVRAECVERGVDPDKLDQVIQQLEERFDQELAEFERGVSLMERAMAPFLEKNE